MERTPNEWLTLIVLASILGMAGQGLRAIVGIKKMNDADSQPGAPPEQFRMVQLVVSLIISLAVGAIAGVLAATSMEGEWNSGKITTFIAAGYAGTDFIEGWMKRQPASGTGAPEASINAVGSARVQ